MPRGAAAPKAAKAAKPPAVSTASPFESSIASLLDASQHSYASHSRCTAKAVQLFASDPVQFIECLLGHLPRLLVVWHKSAPTERVIAFVSSLSKSISSDERHRTFFVSQLCDFLLRCLPASEKAVRCRSAQLLASLLQHTPDDLSESLFESLRKALLRRLCDRQPLIRAAACRALSALQDEMKQERDSDDSDVVVDEQEESYPVTSALMSMAELDSSPIVRKEALESAANYLWTADLRKRFVLRLMDPSPTVRRALYGLLTGVPLRSLSVQHRVLIVKLGTQDAEDGVRRAAAQLIAHWVSLQNGDVIRLLELLAPEHFQAEAEAFLRLAIEQQLHSTAETPKPPFAAQQLTRANSIFWAVLAEQSKDSADAVDALLPDTLPLCDALSMHAQNAEILRNLIRLCAHVRPWDEAGRRRLRAVLEDLAGDPDSDALNNQELADEAVRAIKALCEGGEVGFITLMQRVLERLRVDRGIHGEEFRLLTAEHRERMQLLIERHNARVESGDQDADEDEEEELGHWDLLGPRYRRLLLLVSATVANLHLGEGGDSHPMVLQAQEDIVQFLGSSNDSEVRKLSAQAVARFLLLDENRARSSFEAFARILPFPVQHDEDRAEMEQPLETVEADMQLVALKAVTDLAVAYPSLLSRGEAVMEPAELAFRMLPFLGQAGSDCVESKEDALFVVAMEGLCKLLLLDRLPDIVAPLVMGQLLSFRFHWNHTPTAFSEGEEEHAHRLSEAQSLFDLFRSRYVYSDDEARGAAHVRTLIKGLLIAMRCMAYSAEAKYFPSLRMVCDTVMEGLFLATGGDARTSRDVQGKVVEEALAYFVAFPHSRLIKALVALLDKGATPSKGEVRFMRGTLEQLATVISDKPAVRGIKKAVAAWKEVEDVEEQAELSSEHRQQLQEDREAKVSRWLVIDEEEDIERQHAERCKSRTNKKQQMWKADEEDEENEEEDDVVEDVEEAEADDGGEEGSEESKTTTRVQDQEQPRVRRPMRESRAVAERRMVEDKARQKEQDQAMQDADEEVDEDDEAIETSVDGDSFHSADGDESDASDKENQRAPASHSRQPTMKGAPSRV